MQPQPDDEQIFFALARHGVLGAHTVYQMFPERSVRVLSGRLLKLYQAGFLERLDQLEEVYVEGGGSLPTGYVLDAGGIEWLWKRYRHRVPERFRQLKKRSAAYLFHDIEAAHFVMRLRASVGARDDMEFLYLEEYFDRFAPDKKPKDGIPHVVRAPIRWFGNRITEGTIPDFLFLLHYPRNPPGRQFRSIALEYCRGTETVEPTEKTMRSREFWKQSSLLRKFVVYGYARKSGSFRDDFGLPLTNVLTVTTEAEKVSQMQRAYQKYLAEFPHEVPSAALLFANRISLATGGGDILASPFVDGKGQPVSLTG